MLERDGVANKIESQVSAWRAAGHTAEVFCAVKSSRARGHSDWHRFPFENAFDRARATVRLQRAALRFAPDVVYLRYDLYLPPMGLLLRRRPGVVEINADDRAEAVLVRGARGRLYNELNRRLLLRRARAFVCVTHELARSASFARFRRPTAVVGNAIDLSRISPLPATPGSRPRVAFLGTSGQPWHGVDKLLWLAGQLPDVDFDLIGWTTADCPTPPPPNMTAHGVLPRGEYEPLLAACDLAIGTLALHRKHMTEACPLKVREYLAYGLPVVIAYDDTDFLDDERWFLLRLPNTEDNVRGGVDAIRSFLDSIRGRRVPRADVEKEIGSAHKEALRLAFLESVVS